MLIQHTRAEGILKIMLRNIAKLYKALTEPLTYIFFWRMIAVTLKYKNIVENYKDYKKRSRSEIASSNKITIKDNKQVKI
jgi:hypothetical protein